jgi:poly(3-hydroxybutyrate) depolymerase
MTEPSAFDERPLLDELGRLHRAERAPDELRRALIEELRARQAALRTRSRSSARWRLPAMAALAAGVVAAGWVAIEQLGEGARTALVLRPEPSEPSAQIVAPPSCPDYVGMRDAAALLRTTEGDVLRAGLQVHAVEQPTRRCGTLQRRYLSYVPPSLPLRSSVPVLVILHGAAERAEGMWAVQTRRRFDVLAARHSFIAVYADAVPTGDASQPGQNEPRWQSSSSGAAELDDEQYLQLVVEDLLKRQVIAGQNDVFLVGRAEGAQLALRAAANRPDFYAGVAAFMPLELVPPPAKLPGARLTQALFVVLDELGAHVAKQWALALGVRSSVVDASKGTALPDRVREGSAYALDRPILSSTRDSSVDWIDLRASDAKGPRVRLFDIHRASRLWPSPAGDDDERLLDAFGFRNQDIDGADETWRFFSGREPPAQGPDDAEGPK